ncbi:MAG: universal stress protein [Pyrinomonadaceae bacterium]|nr:universal stress protein [Pyrinomonadaceae bacterium]
MRIILAIDGTKCSDEAVKAIFNFRFSEDDELKLITVIDLAVPAVIDLYAGQLPSSTEIEKSAKENAKLILEKTKKQIENFIPDEKLIITSEILVGSPEKRIVEAARKFEADLIVIGSHGYKSWERLLLGSVSDSVIHHSPCSVLVVRNNQKDIERES